MTPVSQSDRLPPRALPLLYFGFAHLCLGAAFLFLALRVRGARRFLLPPTDDRGRPPGDAGVDHRLDTWRHLPGRSDRFEDADACATARLSGLYTFCARCHRNRGSFLDRFLQRHAGVCWNPASRRRLGRGPRPGGARFGGVVETRKTPHRIRLPEHPDRGGARFSRGSGEASGARPARLRAR